MQYIFLTFPETPVYIWSSIGQLNAAESDIWRSTWWVLIGVKYTKMYCKEVVNKSTLLQIFQAKSHSVLPFYFSDVRAARDQMNMGGLPYPTLPLHEAPARATSLFSQPSSACSSTTSFNGPFNSGVLSPQPHSSYYSGMTGPQHPFYNRVNNREPINTLHI